MQSRAVLALDYIALLAYRLYRIEDAYPYAGTDEGKSAVSRRRIFRKHAAARDARYQQGDYRRADKGFPALFVQENAKALSRIDLYLFYS